MCNFKVLQIRQVDPGKRLNGRLTRHFHSLRRGKLAMPPEHVRTRLYTQDERILDTTLVQQHDNLRII